ncbi:hypothetical protein CRENPOLYSF1_360022 [Crenothrix polyspora]|uniref:Uncharacterized protein n=1 Tax=Crenothrix polyspora TaxID=360316 RepID=A0A1R4HAF6_9GAMM|nr:hypothetical protein CRENPOLYSF1_360022 [Crenothrix polyspora]
MWITLWITRFKHALLSDFIRFLLHCTKTLQLWIQYKINDLQIDLLIFQSKSQAIIIIIFYVYNSLCCIAIVAYCH